MKKIEDGHEYRSTADVRHIIIASQQYTQIQVQHIQLTHPSSTSHIKNEL